MPKSVFSLQPRNGNRGPVVDADSTRIDPRSLAALVFAAVVLRIIWATLIPISPESDAAAYDAFARTLSKHAVFGFVPEQPLAFWPPGTSLLYAAAYWLLGTGAVAVVATNIILSAALLLVTARVCARLYGPQIAVLAVVILTLWPTLVMYTTISASEIPYLLFTMLAVDAWTLPKRSVLVRAGLAGAAIGIATLVRPSAILLPGLLAVCQLALGRRTRAELLEQAKAVVVATVMALVLIAPWTIRNYQLLGSFVLVSTNGGVTLWMGNHPGTDGSFADLPEEVVALPEAERSRVLGEQAKAYIRQDPVAFARRAATKLWLLFGNESVGVGWNGGIVERFGETTELFLKRFTQLTWALLFSAAMLGVLCHVRRFGLVGTLFAPMVMLIAYHAAIHAVVVSQERYHIGFAAPIAVLSALGITMAWEQFRSRSSARTVVNGAAKTAGRLSR